MRSILAALLVLALIATASAQGLDHYLKLRRQHGISQATSVAALETLVGRRILEVQGVVKGSFSSGGRVTLLLERTDGESEFVESNADVEWLHGNQTPARLLIRASRADETAPLEAKLLAAAPESQVRAIEQRDARAAAAAARAAANPKRPTARSTAGTGRERPPKNWNLPASEVAPIYAGFIRGRNPRLSQAEAMEIAQTILGFSIRYGVDARLIMAMVMTESGFRPDAVSRAGAKGLGQLMPGTAAGMGVTNAFDTQQNLWATVRLIRGHMSKYRRRTGDPYESLVLSLAAYNAGSGAVRRHGGVPPFRETQNYIRKVIGLYRTFTGD